MSNRSYVRAHERPLDRGAVEALAETFKVLGDPTRVRILDALSRAEVPVCDLARGLGLTQSAVSHQLRVLRGMRLVRSRRDGRHIYYAMDDEHITSLFAQGLEHVSERRTEATRLQPPAAEDTRIRGGASASVRGGGGAPPPVGKVSR